MGGQWGTPDPTPAPSRTALLLMHLDVSTGTMCLWMDRYTAKGVCSMRHCSWIRERTSPKEIGPGRHTCFSLGRVPEFFRHGGTDTFDHREPSIRKESSVLPAQSPDPGMFPLTGVVIPASKDLRTHRLTLERRPSDLLAWDK